MPKVIQSLKVKWDWSGDEYALEGFNIAIVNSQETTPSEFLDALQDNSIIDEAFVEGNVREHIFRNEVLDDYEDEDNICVYIQAVYPNDRGRWRKSDSNITIEDEDGSFTINTRKNHERLAGKVVHYTTDGAPKNTPDPLEIKADSNSDGSLDIKVKWEAYNQPEEISKENIKDWELEKEFAENDIVLIDEYYYKSKSSHIASESNEPGEGSDWESYWEEKQHKDDDLKTADLILLFSKASEEFIKSDTSPTNTDALWYDSYNEEFRKYDSDADEWTTNFDRWNKEEKEWSKGESGYIIKPPDENDSALTFNVNTNSDAYHLYEGLPPNRLYSFGVSAGRKTEKGLEITKIETIDAWLDVNIKDPFIDHGQVPGSAGEDKISIDNEGIRHKDNYFKLVKDEFMIGDDSEGTYLKYKDGTLRLVGTMQQAAPESEEGPTPIYRGKYSDSIKYFKGEIVKYNDRSWICKDDEVNDDRGIVGKTPGGDNDNWEIYSEKGSDAYRVEIHSTNGTMFRRGKIETKLHATVYKGSKDITDEIPAWKFKWEKSSDYPDLDKEWNNKYSHGEKVVEVTSEDMKGKATFTCSIKN